MPENRGRPKGHRLSDETKAKISRARRRRAVGLSAIAPGPTDMDADVIAGIMERDTFRCRLCRASYYVRERDKKTGKIENTKRVDSAQRMAIHPLGRPRPDPNDDSRHALLCKFCRENAIPAGTRDQSQLPPPYERGKEVPEEWQSLP